MIGLGTMGRNLVYNICDHGYTVAEQLGVEHNRQESGVERDSKTETFAAIKLYIDNWRWQGVPFYLRTGKRMNETISVITIQFRPVPHKSFPHESFVARRAYAGMLWNKQASQYIMEAAKIVELIADRRSIPFLIGLLDDTIFDIRWIAAEGLIKIGRPSICPLLKSVRNGKSSLIFNRGTHHILLSLVDEKEKNKLMPLLQSLDNYHELGGTAPVIASTALKTVYRCNT